MFETSSDVFNVWGIVVEWYSINYIIMLTLGWIFQVMLLISSNCCLLDALVWLCWTETGYWCGKWGNWEWLQQEENLVKDKCWSNRSTFMYFDIHFTLFCYSHTIIFNCCLKTTIIALKFWTLLNTFLDILWILFNPVIVFLCVDQLYFIDFLSPKTL